MDQGQGLVNQETKHPQSYISGQAHHKPRLHVVLKAVRKAKRFKLNRFRVREFSPVLCLTPSTSSVSEVRLMFSV